MSEHDAGQCFHLDVFERGLLDFGETPDLGLGEFDVVDRLGGQTFDRGFDLVPGEPEVAWRPVVELHRQLPHRVIAPRIDVRENPFDRGPHAFIALGGDVGIDTGFDYLDHMRVRKRRVCNVLPMQMTHNSRPRRRGARADDPSHGGEREGISPRTEGAACPRGSIRVEARRGYAPRRRGAGCQSARPARSFKQEGHSER